MSRSGLQGGKSQKENRLPTYRKLRQNSQHSKHLLLYFHIYMKIISILMIHWNCVHLCAHSHMTGHNLPACRSHTWQWHKESQLLFPWLTDKKFIDTKCLFLTDVPLFNLPVAHFETLERVSTPDNAVFQVQLGQVSVPILWSLALSPCLVPVHSLLLSTCSAVFIVTFDWKCLKKSLCGLCIKITLRSCLPVPIPLAVRLLSGSLLAKLQALGVSNFEQLSNCFVLSMCTFLQHGKTSINQPVLFSLKAHLSFCSGLSLCCLLFSSTYIHNLQL